MKTRIYKSLNYLFTIILGLAIMLPTSIFAYDDSEQVIAIDMIVENGEITDIENYFEGISYQQDAVDVVFTNSEPSFDTNVAQDYNITYTVIPKSGNEQYNICRKITVKEPKQEEQTQEQEETGDSDESEETEPETKPEGTETEPEETKEEPIKAKAKANSGFTIEPVTVYPYATYGMGNGYRTSSYRITTNSGSYIAYCSQPSRPAPNGQAGTITSISGDDILARILYYGADAANPNISPARNKGFFENDHPNLPGGARFIVTHLALGKADGDASWSYGSNVVAQKMANELIAYATSHALPSDSDVPSISPLNPEVTFYFDGNYQETEKITFHASSSETATLTLPEGVTIQNKGDASLINGNIIYGGAEFTLRANGIMDEEEFSIPVTSEYMTYTYQKYTPNNSAYQNLAMLASAGQKNQASITINSKWVKHNTISIAKVDDEGNLINGAVLQILNEEGDVLKEWISTDEPLSLNASTFTEGTYTVKELQAPNGYVGTNESHTFTITHTGDEKNIEINFVNNPTKVQFSKKDITNSEELPGATLTILDKEGNIVKDSSGRNLTWVSTDQPKQIDRLPIGEYILREETAPAGYIKSNDVEFTVEATGKIQTVEMVDDVTKVSISKKDITTGEELEGAKLSILDKEGNVVKDSEGNDLTWTSTNEPKYIEKLPTGDYILHEETAPDGYVRAEDVEFTVKETGEIQTVEMIDDITKVAISKKDIVTNDELPGAGLKVLDKEGNVVDEWISTNEPHMIEKLPVGKYTLVEETAPNGYLIAENVEFTVKETGEIQTVVMKDSYTKVQISKKDITNNEELPGATLTILDKEGNIIEKWVSTDEPKMIDKLPLGDYILREETAPSGYTKAEDIEFTVTETDEIQVVEMFDDVTKVQISKRDITTGEELPGAQLRILDKDGNIVMDSNGEELVWISTNEPKYIEKLPAGEYILREEAAPAGYLIAEDIKFTVSDEATSDERVVMKDDYTKVATEKVDKDGNFLAGVTLRLETEDGELVEEFKTTEEAKMFNRLPIGNYVLKEVSALDGYELADPIEFTVEATADIQTTTMVNYLKKVPVVSKKSTSSSTKVPTSVQSGIITWTIIAIVAILGIILLVVKKKNK